MLMNPSSTSTRFTDRSLFSCSAQTQTAISILIYIYIYKNTDKQDESSWTHELQRALVQNVSWQEFDVDDDHVSFLSPALVPANTHTYTQWLHLQLFCEVGFLCSSRVFFFMLNCIFYTCSNTLKHFLKTPSTHVWRHTNTLFRLFFFIDYYMCLSKSQTNNNYTVKKPSFSCLQSAISPLDGIKCYKLHL